MKNIIKCFVAAALSCFYAVISVARGSKAERGNHHA